MLRIGYVAAIGMAAASFVESEALAQEYISGIRWREPAVVTPGESCGDAPSDAIVLFDGKDLSGWEGGDQWKVEDGAAIVSGGDIKTKESFGDCQLHIEWAAPEEVTGKGQGRGNSGVFFMDRYELQVLDSYDNETYFDGQAGAIYKQTPPMANAMRKPGEWNSYDVVWNGPKFKDDGSLKSPARITVLHNGVLVLNNFVLQGATPFTEVPKYEKHGEGPIRLQNHGNPVRFRNIWVREIKPAVGERIEEPYFLNHVTRKHRYVDEDVVAARGKITVDGGPLKNGRILLHAATGKPKRRYVGDVKNGEFEFPGIKAGKYVVVVRTGKKAKTKVGEKYTQAETSGLTIEAGEGDNEFALELTTD